MSESVFNIVLFVSIWWISLSVLAFLDRFSLPEDTGGEDDTPWTDEELELLNAELPQKEAKPLLWYIKHPLHGLRTIGVYILVTALAIVFLPIVLITYIFPKPAGGE